MSMRNEDIQGSLSVSHGVTVGGGMSVRGNSKFDHNVVVKGWLDAPNIKGAFKGLYSSGSALKSAYPRPMPGWYALVGNALPADVWRVDGGEWVPTGEKGGEPNMDLASLVERIEAAEEVMLGTESRVETAEEDIDALEVRMEAAEGDIDALGTADKEQRAYLLQRLQGTAEDSDALHDPHKWLGSVEDDGGLNALLDGLHASGEAGYAKAGFFRGNYGGSPFTVENVPVDYAGDMWLQSVRGRLSPVYAGGADTYKGLTRSPDVYSVLWRVRENGTWGAWNSLTDAPGVPETDLSMGVKDGDPRSCLVAMRTRKGGCYSVVNGMGVVTGLLMVFCDSWGLHGMEQVLLTDVSDLEGGIVHSLSGRTHVDGKPMLYHRFYDMNREAEGRWGAWKTFSMGGGTTEHPYAAFDFATLREKIGSGRTQDDLDAFGLTDEVWTGIRAGETMVVRDDQRERTYIVTGSSDYYISFAYGMGEAYEGWEIRSSGDSFTITVGYTQGGGGTGGAVTIE